MPGIELKLGPASEVLGIAPKDLQNLVQFGVVQPRRRGNLFIFDSGSLLEAKVALFLRDALGMSVPMLAEMVRSVFASGNGFHDGRRDVTILSRPQRQAEAVRLKIPLRALSAELASRMAPAEVPRRGQGWEDLATRAFEEAAKDLKGLTRERLEREIRQYRAQRRRAPEITVIGAARSETA